MIQLVYVSSATIEFTNLDLASLLTVSRSKNLKRGITGLLLYHGGNFIQALEGDRRDVRAIFADINMDKRHSGISTILEEEAIEREFGEWSMGFRHFELDEIRTMSGFSEFLNMPITGQDLKANPACCQRLLRVFRDSMR